VPEEVPFSEVNKTMKKKELGNLIDTVYRRSRDKATVIFADRLKDIGFEFATKAGISISIKDMTIPPRKKELLDGAQKLKPMFGEVERQGMPAVAMNTDRFSQYRNLFPGDSCYCSFLYHL